MRNCRRCVGNFHWTHPDYKLILSTEYYWIAESVRDNQDSLRVLLGALIQSRNSLGPGWRLGAVLGSNSYKYLALNLKHKFTSQLASSILIYYVIAKPFTVSCSSVCTCGLDQWLTKVDAWRGSWGLFAVFDFPPAEPYSNLKRQFQTATNKNWNFGPKYL